MVIVGSTPNLFCRTKKRHFFNQYKMKILHTTATNLCPVILYINQSSEMLNLSNKEKKKKKKTCRSKNYATIMTSSYRKKQKKINQVLPGGTR
jgi:hypothetical protein